MSGEGKQRGKKRPKSYYKKCANVKRKRLNQLDSGLMGFIVSCDREKEATREAYNLLNDYADQLYGPEKLNTDGNHSDDEDEEEDLERAMKKEVDAFKETKPVQRRFQRVESKTKNCIFIKTTLEKPWEVTDKLFEHLLETKVQKSRFAMRLMPVQGTCKAVLEEILKLGTNLFEKYFSTAFGEGLTYSINFKTRNNNIGRDSVIPPLSHIVTDMNPAHSVDHNNPVYLISVQILCNICCISILKNFFKFKKYNLQEVVKDKEVCFAEDNTSKPDAIDWKEEKTRIGSEKLTEECAEVIKSEKEGHDGIVQNINNKDDLIDRKSADLTIT